MAKIYLRADVICEPLVNNWYAWPYLVPPVTFARFLQCTHQRILKSFVSNHQMHILAAKDPMFTGGEFVDCREDQLKDIQKLLSFIENELTEIISVSDAVQKLEDMLRLHTSGETIEGLYSKVPEELRGYVEIFLDNEHNAGYRLIEPLLYSSELYRTDIQSFCFSINSGAEDRSFVFSTPRVPEENNIIIYIPFASDDLDIIFGSRESGVEENVIENIFRKYKCLGGLDWRRLFSDKSESLYIPASSPVSLKYLGHAGFIIESERAVVLVDPLLAVDETNRKAECITYNSLPPRIDCILLTHNHADHFNIETLIQLRYKTKKVAVPRNGSGSIIDPSMRHILNALAFDVVEFDDFDQMAFGNVSVQSLPFVGEHGDLNIRSKSIWSVKADNVHIVFCADCANPEMEIFNKIVKITGKADLLCIGMECVGAPYTWSYGALQTKKIPQNIKNSRRLNGSNCVQAAGLVNAFSPQHVIVYALGLESCFKYLMGIEYEENSKQIIESNNFSKIVEENGLTFFRMKGKKNFEIGSDLFISY